MLKLKLIPVAMVLTAALILGGCGASTPAASTDQGKAAPQASEVKVYHGLGETPVFRVGPGKDAKGGQIYSISYVMANALFDKDGKIIDVNFDSLEILSPNDEEHQGVPVFSGWPTQPGYLGTVSNTNESAATQVAAWQTKRERGDQAYGMNWSEQIGNYQKFFKDKTVAEIEQWFAKNTSDINGRPLKADAKDPKDIEKYNKLTDAEKKALADVTSGSTISLKDAHGDFIGALKKAYENKVEVTVK
ncbi:FMN-binding protein [Paradesulfitobacterium ferrireducens]|uniref:FMN-binding protein n=1 Tax=Paradesulfitobacterium ferrireducens TaxID=2816476 RepID=UPI001A907BCE|nr:FMN-binding protein [Paradesulfitobacterium ferrireducens]